MTEALAIARPATVDADYGGTFSARYVRAAQPELVTGQYIKVVRLASSAHEIDLTAARDMSAVRLLGDADLVFERAKLTALGVVSAATLVPQTIEDIAVPEIYPDFPISAIVSSWAGEDPSKVVSVSVRDRRLDPFFDRLGRIEQGEWNQERGQVPDAAAVSAARQVLHRLGSSLLLPSKVTAADGQIFVYFSHGEKFSTIEILSGGHMLLLISDGHTLPQVTEVDAASLPSAIRQIRAHLA